MSRDDSNPYKRRTDSNYSLNSNFPSNMAYLATSDARTSTSRNDSSTSYRNIIPDVQRRNLDILSNSKRNIHVANMPIFEDPHESGALHRNFNPSFGNKTISTSSKMLNKRNSSALEALQNYGPTVPSPTDFSSNTGLSDIGKLNIANMLSNFSRSIQSPSEPLFDHMHDPESSSTPTDPSYRSFNDLDYLKSVEDEDDFLYGNSSSLPEEPKSALKVSSKMKDEKPNVDWSDDDFDVTSGISQNKFISRNTKTSSIWDVQNIKVETRNVTESWQLENMGDFASEKLLSKKTSLDQLNSLTQSSSVLSGDINSMDNKKLDVNKVIGDISQGTSGFKPKFHIAADILKKQTLSMNSPANKSSSNEKMCGYAETNIENKLISKSTFSNNPKISEKGTPELKTEKASKNTRILPKGYEQKHLEHNKDYIRPHSKDHSKEEYQMNKRTKYDNFRHLSPERHHSPYDSRRYKSLDDHRHRSPYHERYKSPERDLRHRLSSYHSRHRSSDMEYERYLTEYGSSRHYEGHRRHSRSPVRRSREKSPGYRRYKARSPGLHSSRERSRSPLYRRSHEYKRSSKKFSDNSPDHYSKRRKKSKDDSSFCSLSFGSSSDSSDSSSLEEKERNTSKSKRCPQSNMNKDETEIIVVKPGESFDIVPDKSDAVSILSEDISKSLNETSEPINEEELLKIFQMLQNSKRLSEVYQEVQEGNSSFISPIPIVENLTANVQPLAPPSSQMPVISQSYSYPIMSSAPIPYCPPAVSDFSSVIPPSSFPSHPVMPPVPSTYVDPYTTSTFPRVDHPQKIECRTTKHARGPATLINIELDTYSSVPKSNPIKPSDLKVDTHAPSPVKVNSEQNNAIIQEYKKLKYERYLVQCKVKNSTEDVIELRGMMQDAWGKKINASEKIFHVQCKTILNTFQSNVKFFIKEAKRLKEELDKFKAKQSPELQQELVKIKHEDYTEVKSTETYLVADSNSHVCYPCNKQFSSISSYVEHIPTLQHKEQSASDDKWLEHFKKEQKLDEKKRSASKLVQVEGIEFLKSITGFYCALCKEIILEGRSAEDHLLSHDHYVNFKNFLQIHPFYSKKCVFKQLIEYSDVMKQRRKEKGAAEHRRKVDIDLQKVKKAIRNEHSKELKFEVDSDDSDSTNQKLTNTKSTLSGDEAKGISQSCKSPKTKEIQKIVYIGKAPNFKKPLEKNSKPWYKRDNILSKSAEDANSTKSSHSINIKAKPKNLECVAKPSLSKNELNSPNAVDENSKSRQIHKTVVNIKKTSETSVKYTCLTEDEAKHTDSVKSTKRGSEHSENTNTKSSKNINSKNNEMSIPKSKDSVVNQAIKNILLGTASANQDVSLSEITIPKIVSSENPNASSQSTLQSRFENAPVPMDIDNSQDSKSNLRLATEEEKDLFILGINKDDLKPLVIPVPPPSYSNASTILSSNVVSDLAFTKNITDVKQFDFSVPPPTMLPYSRNTPPPPYSNKHSQPVHLFSNPSNVMSIPTFPNSNNTLMYPFSNPNMSQTMSPFSSSNISNQPPYNQYHNQYSIASNMPPASTFLNQNRTPFLSQNVSYDSSLVKGHLNFNTGESKSIPATPANLQTKAIVKKQVSELKQDGRNLITIVPKKKLSELLLKSDNQEKDLCNEKGSAVIETNERTKDNANTKSASIQELSNKDACLKNQNAENNMESSNSDPQDLKTVDSKVNISSNSSINANVDENIKGVETIIISSQEQLSNKDVSLKNQNAESNVELCTSDSHDLKSCEEIRFLHDSINTNVEKIEDIEIKNTSSQELLTSKNDCFKEKNVKDNLELSTLDLQAKSSLQDLKSCDMKENRSLQDFIISNIEEKGKDIETKHTTSQELPSYKVAAFKIQNNESTVDICEAMVVEDSNKVISLGNSLDTNVELKTPENFHEPPVFEQCQEMATQDRNICKAIVVETCNEVISSGNSVDSNVQLENPSESLKFEQCQEIAVQNQNICKVMIIEDSNEVILLGNSIGMNVQLKNSEKSHEQPIFEQCQKMATQDQNICKAMVVVEDCNEVKSLGNSVDSNVQLKNIENPIESPIFEQHQEMAMQHQNICKAMVVEDSKDVRSLWNSIGTNVQNNPENSHETPIFEQDQEIATQDQNICEAMVVEDSKDVRLLDNSIATNVELKTLQKPSEPSILEQYQEMALQDKNICKVVVVEDSNDVKSLDNSINLIGHLKNVESSILEECQEVTVQNQNISENIDIEDHNIIDGKKNLLDQVLNYSVSNLEESRADDKNRVSYKLEDKPQIESQSFPPVINVENDNINIYVEDLDKLPEEKIVPTYKLEDKPQMESQKFPPVISVENDINNDNNICVEDLNKLPEEKIVPNFENILSKENQDLVQEKENDLVVKEYDIQRKGKESNIEHANPPSDITSSQTFADISSSLEKLEKVVSEFNSLPELQVKETDASKIPKLSSDIKKTENTVENENLLDIEKTENIKEKDNLPKPGNSKNDSDTDEYEDNQA